MPGIPPVHTIRHGPVKAAIWENTSSSGRSFFNVTFARGYQDEAGNFKDSDSYGEWHLWALERCATEAYAWIREHKPADSMPQHRDAPAQASESTPWAS